MRLSNKSGVVFLPYSNFFFGTDGRYTFALRQTTLFAENSTIPDEYGLAALANNRLIRHRFGTKFSLHVRSAN